LKSVFEKLRFRDGLVWTPNRRNKPPFSNSSGVFLAILTLEGSVDV